MERVDIVPAIEDDVLARVEFVVVMLAAKDALLLLTVLVRLLIAVAAEELFDVTVPLKVVIDELKDDEAE